MGLLKKLKEENDRQRQAIRKHGQGAMLNEMAETSAMGVFGIRGYTEDGGWTGTKVTVPWGLGLERRVAQAIAKHELKGYRLNGREDGAGGGVVLSFEKTG